MIEWIGKGLELIIPLLVIIAVFGAILKPIE